MPTYVQPTEPKQGSKLWGWIAGGAAVLGVLVLGAFEPDPADSFPDDQAKFVEAVQVAKDGAEGANEMRVVELRETRNNAICSMLPKGLNVRGWYGTVSDVDTTLGGDSGTLEVELDDRIAVGTWNNGFSDALDGASSLITRDSPIYNQVASLENGDLVKFSGTFVPDDQDCVGEMSLTDVGGVESPTFVFAFSDVTKPE